MNVKIEDLYTAKVQSGDIVADQDQKSLLPLLEDLRVSLNAAAARKNVFFRKKPEVPKGIYIWGGVGRGKSMLMDLFVQSVQAPKRRVHFHAFMQEIHAGLHDARKSGAEDALVPVAKTVSDSVRLLAFDEMQINDITDAMIVGRLFELLIADGVAIVTTSNRPPDDLYRNGLNRGLFLPFIELLKQRMSVYHLHSPTDYRQDVLSSAATYFAPADGKARSAIDSIWKDLVDGHAEPLSLTVNGREVLVPAFHNGVARAEFWDLCGKPLGPADHLAIAKAVRVLIVENVPRLSRNNFNEAKRFVTLIDALYEARVKLIASAADVPERLYVEGEGTFEFERTASRLREMQGDDWSA